MENGSPRFHLPFFYGVVNTQTSANHAPLRARVDVYQLAEAFPDLLDRLDGTDPVYLRESGLTCSVCSLYPLLQLSTAAREWVALHLLHYCVYAPSDTRSTRWAAPRTAHDALTTQSGAGRRRGDAQNAGNGGGGGSGKTGGAAERR